MERNTTFPAQKLPFKSKGTKWRKQCIDWASVKTYFTYSPVRKSAVHMKINYDLLNGIIHMEDVARILNPGNISTAFVPEKIQHYPIINSKLNTLRGEEAARVFDWRVIVTNPYAVSQIEEEKRKKFNELVQSIVEDQEIDNQQAEKQLQEGKEFFDRKYQDVLEVQSNELLRHYSKELNFKQIFNEGFMDACTVGMEAYQCSIVGGEPVITRLNPMKLRAFGTGYSDRLEDADVIIYEDYWSRGRIVDTFYDELSPKDIKWLSDEIPEFGGQGPLTPEGAVNESYPFMPADSVVGEDGIHIGGFDGISYYYDALNHLDGGIGSNLLPYDIAGNVRVLRVWWKSKRKIYKVKSFDPITGEEILDFYPETYVADEAAGEEATPYWVNQAWEGTKIGENIYVGMRPCLVQHNRLSNPSRCHFGIVGTVYNLNESKPYSLVDMMKPYNYLYDAIHAKLVELIATNWGKLVVMDLALKPKSWEVDKWMYFARANKVLIKDSFREGDKGAATGKIAGGLNNNNTGYVDADWGQSIQNYINLLQWVKDSMSDLVGINRQREGNTYSRETVGGIERAVLQSSYITDWLFQKHDDTKRRVLDCFIEESQAALRGRSKKFQYILSDGSLKTIEVDGDLYANADLGLLVDNSSETQKLSGNIDSIAQIAIQRGNMKLASIMRLYSEASLAEKINIIEKAEKESEQVAQEQFQQQQQLEQQKIQAEQQMNAQKLQQADALNQRDNDTKIKVAEINAQAEYLRLGIYEDENNEELRREEMQIDKDKLAEEIRQFDLELRQKDKELDQKEKIELKKIEAQKQIASANKNKKQ